MDALLPDDLAFDPVPSARNRHDGWTSERQRAFILALAQLGLVGAAARSVGTTKTSLPSHASPEIPRDAPLPLSP